MNKHSKSLFISLLIHSLLVGAVFYLYSVAAAYINRPQEKRVCIKLGTIKQVVVKKCKSPVKEPKKSVSKKVTQQKKVIKKKRALKKKINTRKTIVKKEHPKKVVLSKMKKVQTVKKDISDTKIVKKQEKCAKTNNTPALHTTQKKSTQEKYINQYLQEIVDLLQENLYYPRRARKRGIEGKVTVQFTLKKSAEISAIKVISSNSEILSRGAIKTLKNLSGEFPHPDEKLILTIPINYKLSN